MATEVVEETLIRYVVDARDTATARVISDQKSVQKAVLDTSKSLGAQTSSYTRAAKDATTAAGKVSDAAVKQASAARKAADEFDTASQQMGSGAEAGARRVAATTTTYTTWRDDVAAAAASAARSFEAELERMRRAAAVPIPMAPVVAPRASPVGGGSGSSRWATVGSAGAAAAGFAGRGVRSAGRFGGEVAAAGGSLALGVGGLAVGTVVEGLKKAGSVTESSLGLQRAGHLSSKEAIALSILAEATKQSPRTLGMSFSTLGGQYTKAMDGLSSGKANPSTKLFQSIGVTPGQIKADQNNLPALYDLVVKQTAKMPAANAAAASKTLLGRGVLAAGVLEAGGPLAGKGGRIAEISKGLPNISAKTLKDMQENVVNLKIATTGIELSFAQAFGPPLIKLFHALIPLMKPAADLIEKGVGGAIKVVGSLLKGPVGVALSTFGKLFVSAGKELLAAFKPAEPFLKNVLLPLLKGVAIGVGGAIIGGIKLLAGAVRLLAPVFGAVGKAAAPFKSTIEGAGKVLGAIFLGPILKLVAGFGRLAEAIPFVGKILKPVLTLIEGAGSGLTKVAEWLANGVGKGLRLVGEAFKLLATPVGASLTLIGGLVTAFWNDLQGVFKSAITVVEILVRNFWSTFVTITKTQFDIVKAVVTTAWSVVTAVFTTALNVVKGVVTTGVAVVKGVWSGIRTVLISPVEAFLGFLGGIGGPILGAFKGPFNVVFGFLKGLASPFLEFGESIINALAQGVEKAGQKLLSIMEGIPGVSMAKEVLGAVGIHLGGGGSASGANLTGAIETGKSPSVPGHHRKAVGGWVPGDPGKDGTLALLAGNEYVLTGHGQELLEAHAPGLLGHIDQHQMPHFAEGGGFGWPASKEKGAKGKKAKKAKVPTTEVIGASEFGGHNDPSAFNKQTASGATANDSLWGFAELSHLGTKDYAAMGNLPMGTKLTVKYGNRSASLPKVDVGTGGANVQGRPREMDLTYAAARALGFSGLGLVSINKKISVSAPAAAKANKRWELTGTESSDPLAAFDTGYQSGLKGTPLALSPLLKQAIVNARVALKTEAAGASSTSGAETTNGTAGNSKVKAMLAAAGRIIGKPYVYGGGHGGFNSAGYDCSGAVSYALHGAGLLNSPVTTDGLKTFGLPGDGKMVTVGVRGTTGQNAHTMMKIGSRFFESGGSGGGSHWDSGWDGNFPIHRHPPGLRRGGRLSGSRPPRRFRSGGSARPAVDPRLSWFAKGSPRSVWQPQNADFVGYGLRDGGHHPHHKRHHRHVTASFPSAFTMSHTAINLISHDSTQGPGTQANVGMKDLAVQLEEARGATVAQIDRLSHGLQGQIARLKEKKGSPILIRRLESALGLVEGAAGQRTGHLVREATQLAKGVARGETSRVQGLERAGVDQSSSAGIQSQISGREAMVTGGNAQLVKLKAAEAIAHRHHDTAGVEAIREQIEQVQQTVAQSMVDIIVEQRQKIEKAAEEAVTSAKHTETMATGALSLLQANQSISGADKTTAGLRAQAELLRGSVAGSQQATLGALRSQESALSSTGNAAGVSAVQEQIQSQMATIASTLGQAAALFKQAALQVVHEGVERAQFTKNIADAGLNTLELQQKLAGTYEGGGGQRADYIQSRVLPALQGELDTLKAELKVAEEQGETALTRQDMEAIANKSNDILGAQLNVQEAQREAIQQVVNNMQNAGGSLGFSSNGSEYTDLLGVGVGW